MHRLGGDLYRPRVDVDYVGKLIRVTPGHHGGDRDPLRSAELMNQAVALGEPLLAEAAGTSDGI